MIHNKFHRFFNAFDENRIENRFVFLHFSLSSIRKCFNAIPCETHMATNMRTAHHSNIFIRTFKRINNKMIHFWMQLSSEHQ